MRKIILYPPRGIIFDRNYIPIVDNNPLYRMKIISKDMQENFNYQIDGSSRKINKNGLNSSYLHNQSSLQSFYFINNIFMYIDDIRRILFWNGDRQYSINYYFFYIWFFFGTEL